jgi:hypothetical protein
VTYNTKFKWTADERARLVPGCTVRYFDETGSADVIVRELVFDEERGLMLHYGVDVFGKHLSRFDPATLKDPAPPMTTQEAFGVIDKLFDHSYYYPREISKTQREAWEVLRKYLVR